MRTKLIALGVAVVVLALLPVALSEFRTVQLATVGAYFIAILGLDVLTGHSGQISLGHGAFMAVGGYTTAILMADHGVRDLWTIPIAAAVAGGIGLLAGVPALRLSGLYLALATFGIAVAFPTILKKFDHFTGGSTGITLFGRPTQTGHGAGVWGMTNNQWLYALTWSVAVVVLPRCVGAARVALRPVAARDPRQRARGRSVRDQPLRVQGGRVRRLGRVRGRRRGAPRDQRRLRQPGHVPGAALALPARRRGRRAVRLDLGARSPGRS